MDPKGEKMKLKQIAHKIQSYYDYENTDFVVRPYNRFDSEKTTWWIVPSKEWPAYKFAKFIISEEDKKIYFGLNVEKGYDENLGIGIAQKYNLKSDWSWHDFKGDIVSGKIDSIVSDINQEFDKKVKFRLLVGTLNSQSNDPEVEKHSNEISFEIKNNTVINFDQDLDLGNELSDINQVNNIKELYQLLESKINLDFLWLDFYIAVSYDKKKIFENKINFDEIHHIIKNFDYLFKK